MKANSSRVNASWTQLNGKGFRTSFAKWQLMSRKTHSPEEKIIGKIEWGRRRRNSIEMVSRIWCAAGDLRTHTAILLLSACSSSTGVSRLFVPADPLPNAPDHWRHSCWVASLCLWGTLPARGNFMHFSIFPIIFSSGECPFLNCCPFFNKIVLERNAPQNIALKKWKLMSRKTNTKTEKAKCPTPIQAQRKIQIF